MRARNIKPGFFENEQLVECEPMARLLFIGLWCLADREGRLEDRPKRIKMQVFPADNCNCDALLGQLADRGLIVRYQIEEKQYIFIPTFRKHQRIHFNEAPSQIPPFEQAKHATTPKTCHHGEKDLSPWEKALRPECLNDECLNDECLNKLPSSPCTHSEPGKPFSSPVVTGGRLRKPVKGKQAPTHEWMRALGNGLRTWFEEEWWPSQLRMVGKKECAIAIYNLNPDELLRERIMAAYLEQRENDFSKREPPKVPHPATWITGCRWEDKTQHSDPYGIEE